MKVDELKNLLVELTKMYFTGAEVTYTKQSFIAKPSQPLVTITMGSIDRPLNPPMKIVDGRPVSFYPATVNVQIDLFTQGRNREIKQGYTPIAENTATDDLLGFMNFLNSDYAVGWCHKRDIAVIVPNTVEDLTDIINDTNYQFRAMAEITVGFTMESIGYTGTLHVTSVKHTNEQGETEEGGDIQGDDVTEVKPEIIPSPSGGGNEALKQEENDYFENVEINKRLMKEEQEDE